jgi:hypothetical protein
MAAIVALVHSASPVADPFKVGPLKTKVINLVAGEAPKNPPVDGILVTPEDSSKEYPIIVFQVCIGELRSNLSCEVLIVGSLCGLTV